MTDTPTASLALADLPPGTMRACQLQGREILVCRTKDGVFAMDNICTHAFARLNEGRLRGTRVICPLHGAAFDVRDGRALGPPATRSLSMHQAAIVDERIEVTLSPQDRPL